MRSTKRLSRRKSTFSLERLETRDLMATWGNPWPTGSNISLSFAPDQTMIAGQRSTLFQSLESLNSGGKDWQLETLRAFQTWAVQANINISVTGDTGADFGTPGALQGDARFGDIRVGAISQSDGLLIQNQPFNYAAGTWAGDVYLNSNAQFSLGGETGFDLFTGMLNEAGNIFGIEDVDTDTTSALYNTYVAPIAGLNPQDVTKIKALYGTRSQDFFEGNSGNGGFTNATSINPLNSAGSNANSSRVTVQADITSTNDKDYYIFTAPTIPGPLTIQLKTSGVSSLVGQMAVYDSAKRLVSTTTAVDPRTGDLSIRLLQPTLGSKYYVAVQSASADVFGVGSYMLRIAPDTVIDVNSFGWTTIDQVNGLYNYEVKANDTQSTATSLQSRLSQAGSFDFNYTGSLSVASDVDYYSFNSPRVTSSSPAQPVLTAMVWGLDGNAPDTRVQVYDSSGRVVPSEVVLHAGGTIIVQAPKTLANTKYYVRVEAYDRGVTADVGNYFLGVDFSTVAEAMLKFDGGTFSGASQAAGASSSTTLSLIDDRLYHFKLESSSLAFSDAVIELEIFDETGRLVESIRTKANQAQTRQVWLSRGTYTLRTRVVQATTTSDLSWSLTGQDISGPVRTYSASGTGSTKTTR